MSSQSDLSDTTPDRAAPREDGKADQLNPAERKAESRQEALLDEAVEESFPASDPPTPKHIT
tara:strand:- start:879 stop:1064 length:186 start_codon:yes stop_codon:yes gene_type:complete